MTVPVVSTLVMTVIGADKPGLVETLAEVVSRHGGNWLDSRMAHLAGEFAGILRVEVPGAAVAKLVDELAAMEAAGLRAIVQSHGEDLATPASPPVFVKLQVIGQDRPGIVARVSRAITSSGANVEELSTGCKCAPMTGEMLFEAEATVSVPDDASIVALRAELEGIASDLMVDVAFD